MSKQYTVHDGNLVLTLEEAAEVEFAVTSPLDPAMITEAETVAEAFENARDAFKALERSREKLAEALAAQAGAPSTAATSNASGPTAACCITTARSMTFG